MSLRTEILSIVQKLIREGNLDRDRLSDVEYVQSVVLSELNRELRIRKALWEKFAPSMVQFLLAEGKLDRDRLSDIEYVKSVILDNLDDLINEETETIVRRRGVFIQAARDTFATGNPAAAIILVVTEIEHSLNSFYRTILSPRLPDDMITEVLRTNNTYAKISWLMLLASGREIPVQLKTRIDRLAEVRNAIVHYKFRPQSIEDDWWRFPLQEFDGVDIEKLISIADELDETLERICEETLSDYELCKQMADNLLETLPGSLEEMAA